MIEHLYNRLRHRGLKGLELPTQNINLVSASNRKSTRIKKQTLIEFKIGDINITQIVLISPQLLTDVILGLDFLMDYLTVMDFATRNISLTVNGECTEAQFVGVRRNATDIISQNKGEVSGISSRLTDRKEEVEVTSGHSEACRGSEIELNPLDNDKKDPSVEKYQTAEHEIHERNMGTKDAAAIENAVCCVATHQPAKIMCALNMQPRKDLEQAQNDDGTSVEKI
jgi:hypothetical protein